MQGFQTDLIQWYNHNKRSLPWRQTTDPYIVWLSEVILQQTRVDQGLDYFNRFLKKWPAVIDLAKASEQEVLKMWQGLGYYSRARNLHAAARFVVENYDGLFPCDYKTLIKLKGVGEYTAAAVSSIAGNEPNAVVDGNVYRLLSRFYGIFEPIDSHQGKKQFKLLAQSLIHDQNPGIFNQAMMEFGALQCVPKNPDCTNCVLAKSCIAFKSVKVNTLPVKQMIKQVRIRFFNYLVLFIELDGSKHYYLHHRNGKDIWKGLFDFPLIETESAVDFNALKMNAMWKQLSLKQGYKHQSTSEEYRHQLTHQSIRAWFHCVQIKESVDGLNKKNVLLVDQKQLERYPVPKLIERFMTDNKLLKTTTIE